MAYRLDLDHVANPTPTSQAGLLDAKYWAVKAATLGVLVDQTPAPGAIAQWNSGDSGHVAYVDSVDTDGSIVISEDNYVQTDSPNFPGGYTAQIRVTKGAAV